MDELRISKINNSSKFRPLAYANSEWNTDVLVPSYIEETDIVDYIEAEVTEVHEEIINL